MSGSLMNQANEPQATPVTVFLKPADCRSAYAVTKATCERLKPPLSVSSNNASCLRVVIAPSVATTSIKTIRGSFGPRSTRIRSGRFFCASMSRPMLEAIRRSCMATLLLDSLSQRTAGFSRNSLEKTSTTAREIFELGPWASVRVSPFGKWISTPSLSAAPIRINEIRARAPLFRCSSCHLRMAASRGSPWSVGSNRAARSVLSA
ncbi:hypothetical protein D3C79_753600 [compost metagenome]